MGSRCSLTISPSPSSGKRRFERGGQLKHHSVEGILMELNERMDHCIIIFLFIFFPFYFHFFSVIFLLLLSVVIRSCQVSTSLKLRRSRSQIHARYVEQQLLACILFSFPPSFHWLNSTLFGCQGKHLLSR